MASTMTARSGHAPGNALTPSLPLIGTVPDPPACADGLWILPLVADAIDAVMSRKEAAIRLEISEPLLSRQLSASDGKCMNFEKFGRLGNAVAIALCERLRRHFGLDDPAERTRQAVEMVTRGLSMLVAETQR